MTGFNPQHISRWYIPEKALKIDSMRSQVGYRGGLALLITANFTAASFQRNKSVKLILHVTAGHQVEPALDS